MLTELGKAIDVIWFDAGHGVPSAKTLIDFQELELRFAYAVLQSHAQKQVTA